MSRLLLAAILVAVLVSSCMVVVGPDQALIPGGEPVQVSLRSGGTYDGELVAVTDTELIVSTAGRFAALEIAAIQSILVTRYEKTLTRSLAEKLPPYSRYPQGLSASQWDQLLRRAGQADFYRGVPESLQVKEDRSSKADPTGEGLVDNGDGTVTDWQSGLMWQREDDGSLRTPVEAKRHCSALKDGGSSDWRVPSLTELLTIRVSGGKPTVDSTYFPHTKAALYVSASPGASHKHASAVDFGNGSLTDNVDMDGDRCYVRCVRDVK